MKRSREESHVGNNNQSVEKVPYPPPLNLPLTISPELINLIENLKEHCPCRPPQQKLPDFTENVPKTSTPPKCPEKIKAINFPVHKITIGQWSRVSVYDGGDIVAKFYFAKKKLMWEFLDPEEPKPNMVRLKRKIEIQWDDVLSLKDSINLRDETGILEIELRKRPTFFIETNIQAGKHTQWKQLDQDFTDNQASICRRHKLHFHAGVLQKNLEKLVSANSFWSELYKVRFPVQEYMYFDIGFVSNNNTDNNNSSRYSHSQTLCFSDNDDLLQHHSQGIGHIGVGEGNFDKATQFWANGGWQINPYAQANTQNNTANELRVTQAIPPSSQVINGHHNSRRYFTNSQNSNLMIKDERGNMQNTREILESQTHALFDTQPNLMISPHKNEPPMYPLVGSYLASTLLQEEARQHMEHTRLDGDFHNNNYQQNPYNSSYDWLELPDIYRR